MKNEKNDFHSTEKLFPLAMVDEKSMKINENWIVKDYIGL